MNKNYIVARSRAEMNDELKEKLENVLLVVMGLDNWSNHIRCDLDCFKEEINDIGYSIRGVLASEMLKDKDD